MQKASVKSVNIIDTISELAKDEGQANQLVQMARRPMNQTKAATPPKLKPRNPKVNVPILSSTSTPNANRVLDLFFQYVM